MTHQESGIFSYRPGSSILRVLVALLISVMPANLVCAQAIGKITLDDVVSVPWLGNPVLSPDGKQLVLIRRDKSI
jgi:hypothetical protein